jgi:predicted lipid-binding transport protein (Tim44 family)
MATTTSVSQLYGALTQLAYSVTQMAGTPILPFMPPDVPQLTGQATSLAALAMNVHNRDPDPMLQANVDSAIAHLQAAQSLFDIINNHPTNSLTSANVIATTNSAIASAQAV